MKRFIQLALFTALLSATAFATTPILKEIKMGKLKRKYWVQLPRDYEPGNKYAMVVLLHGRFGTGQHFLKYTDIGFIADREGVIVVAPDGYKKSWNDGRLATPAHKANVDDVAFIGKVMDEVQAAFTVDPKKVYCAGMSNGGFMTLALSNKIGQRFAAIGVFTASAPEKGVEAYLPTSPLPLIIINGTEDPLVKYKGGPISKRETQPIMATEAFLERYCKAIGCGESTQWPYTDKYVDGTNTIVHQWADCKNGAEVQLWQVVGGGHTIPSKAQYLSAKLVGVVSRDFDGVEVMWAFLKGFGQD